MSSGKITHIYTFPAISSKEHSMLSHSTNSTLFCIIVSDWRGYSGGFRFLPCYRLYLFAHAVLFVEVLKFLASDQNSGGKWKCFCGAHGIERWHLTSQLNRCCSSASKNGLYLNTELMHPMQQWWNNVLGQTRRRNQPCLFNSTVTAKSEVQPAVQSYLLPKSRGSPTWLPEDALHLLKACSSVC